MSDSGSTISYRIRAGYKLSCGWGHNLARGQGGPPRPLVGQGLSRAKPWLGGSGGEDGKQFSVFKNGLGGSPLPYFVK